MTKVEFLTDKKLLCGFCVSGHSTDSQDDIDGKIVCSAVSSACFMAANTITDVIGDECVVDVNDGYMRVEVKNISDASLNVLKGLKLHLSELSKQYDSIKTTTSEV